LIRCPHEVCAVFTQPDRPAGRGQKPHPPPIKSFAIGAGIPVFQPEKIRAPEHRPELASFRPDFVVVVAYGQILPAWLLELPRLGCVNVHGSLLPRYRGAAPIAWSIINGDTVTGITTMLMDEHLDTGPMLLKQEVPIADTITAGQLSDKMAQVGAELLILTLAGLQDGSVKPTAQDDALATFAPRITKDLARISWDRDARSTHNLIRGLNPWPLAYSECLGDRIQIMQSLPPDDAQRASEGPGTFLGMAGKGLRVACGSGSVLEIQELQSAGKKRVSGRDFANGARLAPGQLLFS
jgi:methionyl-tRNA formyltransferase